jgi:hypothetical protein
MRDGGYEFVLALVEGVGLAAEFVRHLGQDSEARRRQEERADKKAKRHSKAGRAFPKLL